MDRCALTAFRLVVEMLTDPAEKISMTRPVNLLTAPASTPRASPPSCIFYRLPSEPLDLAQLEEAMDNDIDESVLDVLRGLVHQVDSGDESSESCRCSTGWMNKPGFWR